MYITPSRYRTMGFGADLDGIEDVELAAQLGLAARLINRFCSLPPTYDFRGATVTNEPHVWRMGNYMWPGSGRVWLDCVPVKAISSFTIWVTNTQYLNVETQYLHYDKSRNILEPVIAASSIGIWSYTAIPVAGFREPEARVSYTYGWEFPVTSETMYPDGGAVYRAEFGYWTEDAVTVRKNGTELTLTDDYTVDRTEGTITLVSGLDLDDVVSIDYAHTVPPDVAYAQGLIATQLLGNRAIVVGGMQGISGFRVEEVEVRQSRDAQAAKTEVSGLAAQLLQPYKRLHWGG